MSSPKSPGLSVGRFEKTLTAARQGEQSQLGILLDVYRRYLLSVASRKLSNSVAAKAAPSDLVQEALLHAYQGFGEFRGSSERELRAWLNQILARKIIDVHRYYRNYAKRDISREILLSDLLEEDVLKRGAASLAAQNDIVAATESARKFDAALNTLSAEQRQVIQLRSIDQLSFEEVGRRMGRTDDASQKLWARAVQNLTRALHAREAEG